MSNPDPMSKVEAQAFIDSRRGDSLSDDELSRAILAVFDLRYKYGDERMAESMAELVADELERRGIASPDRQVSSGLAVSRGLGRQ